LPRRLCPADDGELPEGTAANPGKSLAAEVGTDSFDCRIKGVPGKLENLYNIVIMIIEVTVL
jgi:hypothetical protein